MSETIVVETWKQHAGIGVIQSLGVSITTIGVETIVMPNIDVVKKEVLIRFVAKLGSGLGGLSSKEFESEFDTTNNYYRSSWHTSNGVY